MDTRDDIDRIMEVMAAAFDPAYGEAWTRRQVEDALVLGNCRYQLVNDAGLPPSPGESTAGFCLSRTGFGEEELLLFAVSPQYRQRGLGRKLLKLFVEAARSRSIERLLLEMRRGNSAEQLYRSFGFIPVGERPNYYRAPDGSRIDAITFAYVIEY